MKVKAKVDLYENYKLIHKGEVFETSLRRAKALGNSIEILRTKKTEDGDDKNKDDKKTEEGEKKTEEKAIEKPKKDKMVHKAKKK